MGWSWGLFSVVTRDTHDMFMTWSVHMSKYPLSASRIAEFRGRSLGRQAPLCWIQAHESFSELSILHARSSYCRSVSSADINCAFIYQLWIWFSVFYAWGVYTNTTGGWGTTAQGVYKCDIREMRFWLSSHTIKVLWPWGFETLLLLYWNMINMICRFYGFVSGIRDWGRPNNEENRTLGKSGFVRSFRPRLK